MGILREEWERARWLRSSSRIHQPNFLPWLGFFHKLASSDVFVLLDTVQFSRGSRTNRVQVLAGDRPTWLTVPVRRPEHGEPRIADALHRRLAAVAAQGAAHARGQLRLARGFEETLALGRAGARRSRRSASRAQRERASARIATRCRSTRPRVVRASELDADGGGSELLAGLVARGRRHRLPQRRRAPAAITRTSRSRAGRSRCASSEFRHPDYPQRTAEPVHGLSVVDAMMSLGVTGTHDGYCMSDRVVAPPDRRSRTSPRPPTRRSSTRPARASRSSRSAPRADAPHVLWRHDVDVSVHRALGARAHRGRAGVRSTWFLSLHSPFYSLLERGGRASARARSSSSATGSGCTSTRAPTRARRRGASSSAGSSRSARLLEDWLGSPVRARLAPQPGRRSRSPACATSALAGPAERVRRGARRALRVRVGLERLLALPPAARRARRPGDRAPARADPSRVVAAGADEPARAARRAASRAARGSVLEAYDALLARYGRINVR